MNLQSNESEVIGGPYPERPGEPNCVYYIRTGQCGYGLSCRFNHPPDRNQVSLIMMETVDFMDVESSCALISQISAWLKNERARAA